MFILHSLYSSLLQASCPRSSIPNCHPAIVLASMVGAKTGMNALLPAKSPFNSYNPIENIVLFKENFAVAVLLHAILFAGVKQGCVYGARSMTAALMASCGTTYAVTAVCVGVCRHLSPNKS